MRAWIGTSGFSYATWKGRFYPPDLASSGMLRFYSERLPAVEINNTFYRMPKTELLKGWSEQVPSGFSFALKAPRRITHQQRLRDAGDSVAYLFKAAAELGGKLGPVLFQLPPFFKKDVACLRDFLLHLPDDRRAAFEFRHASWFDDEVYEVLQSRGVALVGGDPDEAKTPLPLVKTASWGYLRLRSATYDDPALENWVERIAAQAWQEAFVFFKHETEGPSFAEFLLSRLSDGATPAGPPA